MSTEKAKPQLPAEVHTHFQRANRLHGYVEKSLGEATQHALETGNELMAAKAAIPHGSWESECSRLFDGSASAARFYMAFARNIAALPKRQASSVLLLESTLEGAAKAAKKAAAPKPKPAPATPPPGRDDDEEPPEEEAQAPPPSKGKPDYGRCPNCAGTKWDVDDDGVSCAKCHHPHGEPAGDVDEDRLKTQRQKTAKTAEALMRAFDDLQLMLAKPEHGDVIDTCKELLAAAKGWK